MFFDIYIYCLKNISIHFSNLFFLFAFKAPKVSPTLGLMGLVQANLSQVLHCHWPTYFFNSSCFLATIMAFVRPPWFRAKVISSATTWP